MHPCVCRGATFNFKRYFVLQCLPPSSSPFFRSVHCRFLPVKYRFYLTSFYWIKRLLNTPAKYFSWFLLDQNTALFHDCKTSYVPIQILINDYKLWCQSLSLDMAEPWKLWDIVCNFNCYVFVFVFVIFGINLKNNHLTRANLSELGDVVENREQNDGKNVHPATKQLEMFFFVL